MLTESLLLALFAGALGLVFAVVARRLFVLWDLEVFAADMRLDHRVLGASLLTCVLTALVFGMIPALAASRTSLTEALRDGAATVRKGSMRAFQGLAALQIALATVLLVGTATMASNLWSLRTIDLGFDDRGLVRAGFFLGDFGYTKEETRRFLTELERRVAELPNVRSTSRAAFMPPVFLDIERQFRLPEDPELEHSARLNIVDDSYFSTLGIALQHGRAFDGRELESSPTVVINELLARQLWPGEEPGAALGRTLLIEQRRPGDPEPEHRIVGVVQTIKQHDLRGDGEPILYLPAEQRPNTNGGLIARVEGDSDQYIAALRRIVNDLDPRVQADPIHTSAELRWDALVAQRLQAQAVGMLAVVGFLLSLIGVFGVMQLTVARRRREIGLRMALGSNRSGILRWMLAKTALMAIVGSVVGLGVALWSTRLLRTWVKDLGTPPVWIVALTVGTLVLAAVAATLVPARRAARIQPAEVLRGD
jgi:predicted permease